MKFSLSKPIAVAVCAVAGLSVGGGVVAFADDQATDQVAVTQKLAEAQMPNGVRADTTTESWPKNEHGLTYGYATPADVAAGNIPDLRPFQPTPVGISGFLRNDETYLPEAKTTEEEIARTSSMYNAKGEQIRNLYGPDGKTVLTTFVYSTMTMADEQGRKLNPQTGEALRPE